MFLEEEIMTARVRIEKREGPAARKLSEKGRLRRRQSAGAGTKRKTTRKSSEKNRGAVR